MRDTESARLRTKAHEVREVLSDGHWHSNSELVRVAQRFGGRIQEIRNGSDGLPAWFIERRKLSGGCWEYRFAGLNPNPAPCPPPGSTWKGRALRAERRLRALERERESERQWSLALAEAQP